jgi:hypothetical protein
MDVVGHRKHFILNALQLPIRVLTERSVKSIKDPKFNV